MPEDPSSERRKDKRVPFINEVEVVGVGIYRCSDISIGGMYLETIATFPLGTELTLQFKLQPTDSLPIKVQTRVLYEHPGVGVGLVFENLIPEIREYIQKFVDQR